MPLAEWERVLGVNLTGPFLCSRELVRRLPGGRGPAVIVNVSSVHEVIPWPRFAHYCASKGGLKLFGQTIARELAPRQVRVVAVAPGAILTPINRELIEDPGEAPRAGGADPLGPAGRAGGDRRRHRLARGPGGGVRDRRHAVRGRRHDAVPKFV